MTIQHDQPLRMSVREFAQPNLRRGHIDAFSGYQPELQVGVEIHQRVQERLSIQDPAYKKEVYLKQELKAGQQALLVTGRADGVFQYEDEQKPTTIEEIKTTASLEHMTKVLSEKMDHPYRLQTETYGYLWYLGTGEVPRCRLRLISSLTHTETELEVEFDLHTYETWLAQRLAYLSNLFQYRQRLIDRRQQAAANMHFPFSQPRPGQQELVTRVAETVTQGRQLIVQAPTGLGKTIGVLYPALQDALSRGRQTLYVTPKNSQHRLARESVERLQDQELPLRSLTLTAKSKICMQEEPLCTPEHCEYAKNYYDKLSEHQILSKLREKDNLTKEDFKAYADQYKVCPFELSLEAAHDVEAVICDYNYVFSPRNAFESLFIDEDGNSKRANLVIDEAHNLPQRALDYFSPRLSTKFLRDLKEREKELPKTLQARWRRLLQSAIQCVEACAPPSKQRHDLAQVEPEFFSTLLDRINGFSIKYFEQIEGLRSNDPVAAFQRYWNDFCFALDFGGEAFFVSYERNEEGDILKITCCDASPMLVQKIKAFHSVVAFSATLKPFEYFQTLCGFTADRVDTAEFASPFPRSHRKLLVIPQVSTKFRDRARNYGKIGQAIGKLIAPKTGNYFVFFPSFDFMNQVIPHIETQGYRIMVQQRNTSHEEAEEIIRALQEQSRRVLVLGVQGGVFSEGVDYPGDSLIGAIIVGPGLPGYDFERELMRKYYDKIYRGLGFQYAYVYPAMTKVIQAAGRVIRSEKDRGVIVLMDQRFLQPEYASVMPDFWYEDSVHELVSSSILQDLRRFWQRTELDAT